MKVEAFRTQKDKEKFKTYLKNNKDKRLYPMFVIGSNTGLRISDIVPLKVNQFRNKEYLIINSEKKTGKRKKVIINDAIKNVIKEYYQDNKGDEYLFKSQKGGHICEVHAWRLLKDAGKRCKFNYNIGTHTMRKTLGKEINKKYGIDTTQKILGHNNQRDTLQYLGIEQEMLDGVMKNIDI
ncbi:tyrosine-type recombinase/integrase [Clostridioides sp. ES-S-0108-01]|uniref:tyrosine-type recombinase/integrase n=1 Tax=unclassified Clostridioides TaxID=2635829 RepID=UPI001D0C5E3F|nr:tyrosine-type recombinase/integrase [Clostridioides sp. ES-S-0107-01]MCC0785118.1 tyrosine-type recombinase/integrase [Clostridioides sp. ES-S-0108-01]UDN53144.1 tyrosine-type recombinase/integrase [Clostridioides sp. ES-S-0107-01]